MEGVMVVVYKAKPCATCGELFQPKTSREKYCSEKCKRGTAVCVGCGKEFLKTKGTTGLYCSPACWYEAPGKHTFPEQACLVCGKMFFPTHKGQKYCSRDCADVGRRKPMTTEKCPICGVAITYKPGRERIYCSRSCAMVGRMRTGAVNREFGTKMVDVAGYVRIKVGTVYPGAYKTGWMLEHHYVMQEHLGRLLEKTDYVHHKNGNREDNSLSNLELCTAATHVPGVRVADVK